MKEPLGEKKDVNGEQKKASTVLKRTVKAGISKISLVRC